jgi:hypothetical protein
LSRVADLRHVKEPCWITWKSDLSGQIIRTFHARSYLLR